MMPVKILGHVLLVLLLLSFAAPAFATTAAPASIDDLGMALLFNKLTRQKPDFQAWVEKSPEYKKASSFERIELLKKRQEEMQNLYGLTLPQEPFFIDVKVPISSYSEDQQGMMIYSFNEQNFFTYVYMGQHYALIPSSMSRFQWIRVDPEMAKDIWAQADEKGRIKAIFKMAPVSADKRPMRMRSRNYLLVMAEVKAIQIWTKDGEKLIWESPSDKSRNPLLKLWQ